MFVPKGLWHRNGLEQMAAGVNDVLEQRPLVSTRCWCPLNFNRQAQPEPRQCPKCLYRGNVNDDDQLKLFDEFCFQSIGFLRYQLTSATSGSRLGSKPRTSPTAPIEPCAICTAER